MLSFKKYAHTIKDLTDQIFGRWRVVGYAGSCKRGAIWTCQCNCDKQTIKNIKGEYLRLGDTKSCGCLTIERNRNRATHKLSNTYIYKTWTGMIQRCYNKNNPRYYLYGERGITVCQRWLLSVEDFYKDMGERPKGHSLDRINVNGNYEPSNCRWANTKTQARNKRNIPQVTFNGQSMSLAEWGEKLNIPTTTLNNRIYRLKWPIDIAFTTPVKKYRTVIYNGEEYLISELAKIYKIRASTLSYRIFKIGWTIDAAVNTRSRRS